jgi:hypothetical protein
MRSRVHQAIPARHRTGLFRVAAPALGLVMSLSVIASGAAQQATAPASRTPRSTAPLDLEGHWVSVVTEDWRWRMMTPPKGDASGIPLNPEGRKVVDAWDLARDNASGNQCRAYGAGGIMRMPTRLRISWDTDSALRIVTDAGKQTRIVHMLGRPTVGGGLLGDALAAKPRQASLQGYSVGTWELRDAGRPIGDEMTAADLARTAPLSKGSLMVVTAGMRAGYLRKNGIPYSETAVLTEYFDRHDDFGSEWFTVLSVLDDPRYLTSPFVTTTHYKREPDASKWNPQSCETLPPTIDFVAKGDPGAE